MVVEIVIIVNIGGFVCIKNMNKWEKLEKKELYQIFQDLKKFRRLEKMQDGRDIYNITKKDSADFHSGSISARLNWARISGLIPDEN